MLLLLDHARLAVSPVFQGLSLRLSGGKAAASAETGVHSPGQEDPLEKELAT